MILKTLGHMVYTAWIQNDGYTHKLFGTCGQLSNMVPPVPAYYQSLKTPIVHAQFEVEQCHWSDIQDIGSTLHDMRSIHLICTINLYF